MSSFNRPVSNQAHKGITLSAAVAISFVLASCGSSGTETPTVPVTPPAVPNLANAAATTLVVGTAATINFTNGGGGALLADDATPNRGCTATNLPAGLAIGRTSNTNSCTITGTPNTATTEAVTVTVTARNATGVDATPATVAITINPADTGTTPALPNLAYAGGDVSAVIGTAITTITFTNSGDGELLANDADPTPGCSTSPALPSGLTIQRTTDGSSCEITGTPDAVKALDTYTVTARNATGPDATAPQVKIAVSAASTVAIPNFASRILGNVNIPLSVTFTNNGDSVAANGCTLKDAATLPTGLNLTAVDVEGTMTCRISGTPSQAKTAIYTLVATGTDATTDEASFYMEVVAQEEDPQACQMSAGYIATDSTIDATSYPVTAGGETGRLYLNGGAFTEGGANPSFVLRYKGLVDSKHVYQAAVEFDAATATTNFKITSDDGTDSTEPTTQFYVQTATATTVADIETTALATDGTALTVARGDATGVSTSNTADLSAENPFLFTLTLDTANPANGLAAGTLAIAACTDTTNPTATAATTPASSQSATAGAISFTASEAGTAYVLLLPPPGAGESAPDADAVVANAASVAENVEAGAVTVSINTRTRADSTPLTAETTYAAYVVIRDEANNLSEVIKITDISTTPAATADTTAPTVSAVTVDGIVALGATLNLTSDEAGDVFVVTLPATTPAPTNADAIINPAANSDSNEFNDVPHTRADLTATTTTAVAITDLEPTTAHIAYYVVVDVAGNATAVAKTPMFTTTEVAVLLFPVLDQFNLVAGSAQEGAVNITFFNGTASTLLAQDATTPGCQATNLPAGLTINQVDQVIAGLTIGTTCQITGTVTLATTDGPIIASITATSAGGSSTTVVLFAIAAATTTTDPVLTVVGGTATRTFAIDTPITPIVISFTDGGDNPACTVAPALPQGLSVTLATAKDSCTIEGTPEVASASKVYTITVTNGAQTGTATVTIATTDPTDTTAPTLSPAPTVTALTDTTATVSLTSNEAGTGYILITARDAASTLDNAAIIARVIAAASSDVVATTAITIPGTATTTNITGLTASTTYTAYIVATDNAATPNNSTVATVDFATEATPDVTDPVISAVEVTNTFATSAQLQINNDEDGMINIIVLPDAVGEPTMTSEVKSPGLGTISISTNSINTDRMRLIDVSPLQSNTEYKAYVVITDASGNESEIVASPKFATSNVAPVANAGSVSTVLVGGPPATLDGTGSTDDGAITTYAWAQTTTPDGVTGTLTRADTDTAIFTPTAGTAAGDIVFTLTVTDNGNVGDNASPLTDSDTVTVTVALVADTTDPVISAVSSSNGTVNSVDITLTSNESGSVAVLAYLGPTQPDVAAIKAATGDGSVQSNVVADTPLTLTVPGLSSNTRYTLAIVATDGSANDSMVATENIVTDNAAPVASTAGSPTTANTGDPVMLTGTSSTDDGMIASYAWVETSNTTNTPITLDDNTSSTPSFTVASTSTAGEIVFTLTVTDDGLSGNNLQTLSDTATATIVVSDTTDPVLLDFIPGTAVPIGGITLGSTIVSLRSNEAGSVAVLVLPDGDDAPTAAVIKEASGDGSIKGTIVAGQMPTLTIMGLNSNTAYRVHAVVTDLAGNVSVVESSTSFKTLNAAPIANAGATQTVLADAMVQLNGSGTDVDNDDMTLTYLWTQPSGTTVTLSSTSIANPTFDASVADDAGETLVFNLVVTDSDNEASAAASTSVVVGPLARPDLQAPASAAFVYETEANIEDITFANIGGKELSGCVAEPALPTGLMLAPTADNTSCIITGTVPATAVTMMTHTITASNAIDADATPVSITITVNLAVRVNTVSAVATSDVSATVTVTSNVAATAHTLVQLASLAPPNATAIRAAVTQPLGMTATLTAHTPSEFTFTGLMLATEYTAYTVITVGGTDSDIDDQDFTTFPAPPATITVPPATIGGNQAIVSVGSIVSGTVHALVLPATTAAPTNAAALKAASGVMQMPVSAGASVDLTFTGLTAEIAHTAYAIVSFANGGDSNMVTANFTTTVLLTLGTTTITRVAGSEIDVSTSSSLPGTLFLLVLADTDTTSVPATAIDLVMVTVGDMTGAYAQAFSFNASEASSIVLTAEDLMPGVGYTLYLTVANLAGEIADITTLKAQTALPEFTAPTDTVYLVKDVAYDDTVDAANNAMPDTPAQFIDPRYVGNNAPTGVIDECTLTAVDGQAPDLSNPLLQLPSGVSLEVLDTGIGCAFTGTPTIFTPSREYTFTATDDSEVGSVPVSVRIKVVETAGPSLQPLASSLLILELNRVYAEATDEMPDLTAVRVVNRGGPPESCVATTTNLARILSPEVSSDGETCVLVGTPAMVSGSSVSGYFLDATASVGGSDVTSRITVLFHVVASLTDSTPLAVVDSGQSGRLRTVLAGAIEYRTTTGFPQNPFSEPGVAFNSLVTSCTLAPDSPPLPGGLSLHVSSDLRACVIGISQTRSSRIVTDIAEYTIIGSRGDIGRSDFQSATGTLRLDVVAGDFTTPVLSISHGAADAENTVILNPSTPVAIPFANTGSKLSSTFVDACQVAVGTLPAGLSVRLATEADQNNSIAEEGETCILVGTPGATAAEAVNITISYPNTKTNNQRTSAPPLATYQFSIEVATTPGFVASD